MTKTFEQRVSAKIATLTTVASVTTLAKSMKTRNENMDVDLHSAACAALYCAMTHKDTSAAAAVMNAVGKHTRGKTLAAWLEDRSNMLLVVDKKSGLWAGKMVPAADRKDDETLADMFEAAKTDPFWKLAEKGARDFSLHEALAALLKRAASAKAKETLSDDDRVALAEMGAIAEKIKPAPVTVELAEPAKELAF